MSQEKYANNQIHFRELGVWERPTRSGRSGDGGGGGGGQLTSHSGGYVHGLGLGGASENSQHPSDVYWLC